MPLHSHNSPWPQRVLLTSGSFCLALGFLVIAGWHFRDDTLIRLIPSSAPMYYNVAVGFCLSGIGLLGIAYSAARVVLIVGILLSVLGISTLGEYVFGVDFAIDQLLKADQTKTNIFPGRMSPTAALCLALNGFALCLSIRPVFGHPAEEPVTINTHSALGLQKFFAQTTLPLELLITVTTTWGLATGLLYLVGMMSSHILGNVVNMAIHTTVGLVVFGVGLWAVVWRKNHGALLTDGLSVVITIVFTLALVLQLALSSLASLSIASVQTSMDQKDQSERIVYLMEQLVSQLKDAETGQRGYLLTGNMMYLEPYQRAVANIQTTLRDLDILATNSRVLGNDRLGTLQELTEQKLDELQDTIRMRQHEGFDSAVNVVLSGRGKDLMDRMRDLIRTAIDTERAATLQESTEVSASMQETRGSILYGSVFSLLLIPVAGLLINWQLWKRRVTERELRVLNANLDHEVEARTAELAEANVELQRENLERVRAEEALAQSVRELARSNSELEHFAHVASHDLQEPLRKILAFGDRLKVKSGAGLNEQGRDYLERMQSAAARMQNLIDDLLTFSRVTTQPHPFTPVDLSVVAHTIVSDMEISIQRVNGHVDIGALPTIEADAVQIGQVLQNLIGNALKFHRKEVAPVVTISAELVDHSDNSNHNGQPRQLCRMSVCDNGIGFNEKYAEQIFQPFQRLFARGEYEGTGMGLAICKRIVERHGGSIVAHSVPGEGTTFVLTLPVHQPQKEVGQ